MPTSYTDQFFFLDPANPPGTGTFLSVSNLTLTDQNDDLDFDRFDNDSVNGSDITSSYPGDTVTVQVSGLGNVTYTGITFYLANGSQVFTPTDGQVLQSGNLVTTSWVNTQGPLNVSDMGPPCFTAGTLIETEAGPRRVEDIRPGDRVLTRDHGMQPVRWCGMRRVAGLGDFAPIRFAQGAIGNHRALYLSPQHRVLVSGWKAELYYGQDEVLVAAKHLVDGVLVTQEPCRSVAYHHMLFDRHEIVWAEGVETESFHPGDVILDEDREMRAEVLALFPDIAINAECGLWHTARTVIRGQDAGLLRNMPRLAA